MFTTYVERFSCYDVVDLWLGHVCTALRALFVQLAPDNFDYFDTLSPLIKSVRSRNVLGKDETQAISYDPAY